MLIDSPTYDPRLDTDFKKPFENNDLKMKWRARKDSNL
jgi:hypothetical protein